MKEFFEIRLEESDARRFFPPDVGRTLGDDKSVRSVKVSTDDPWFLRIGQKQFQSIKHDDLFYYSGAMTREYTPQEWRDARLFSLQVFRCFEPAGEEVGTEYDESQACPHCGAGAVQKSPLRLRLSSIPKKADFAVTIANEHIVSAKAAEVLKAAGVIGMRLDPVFNGIAAKEPMANWFQLVVEDISAEIVSPTRIGTEPFDWDQNEFACRRGDTLGLGLYSAITANWKCNARFQIGLTSKFLGRRAGLLRPERSILVTPAFRQLCIEQGLKGCLFHVAHLADDGRV